MNSLKNINFLTKSQYSSIINPSDDELWAIETPAVIEVGTYYRLWSDGFCEQWGQRNNSNISGQDTVNLYFPYRDTTYNITVSGNHGVGIVSEYVYADIYSISTMTRASFKVLMSTNADTPASAHYSWRTCGYIQ